MTGPTEEVPERKDHSVWVWHGDTQTSEVVHQDKVVPKSDED